MIVRLHRFDAEIRAAFKENLGSPAVKGVRDRAVRSFQRRPFQDRVQLSIPQNGSATVAVPSVVSARV